jgi:uncharacterized membrane protein
VRESTLPRLFKIAGVGMLTGIRSMSGPAFVVPRLYAPRRRFPFSRAPKSPRAARVLRTLAVAEMIGDKLPFAPDRTAPVPLMTRTLIGAVTGALAGRALGGKGASVLVFGALTGGAAAAAGAYGAFHFRRWLERSIRLPGFLAGLVEDAAVVQLGNRLFATPA